MSGKPIKFLLSDGATAAMRVLICLCTIGIAVGGWWAKGVWNGVEELKKGVQENRAAAREELNRAKEEVLGRISTIERTFIPMDIWRTERDKIDRWHEAQEGRLNLVSKESAVTVSKLADIDASLKTILSYHRNDK